MANELNFFLNLSANKSSSLLNWSFLYRIPILITILMMFLTTLSASFLWPHKPLAKRWRLSKSWDVVSSINAFTKFLFDIRLRSFFWALRLKSRDLKAESAIMKTARQIQRWHHSKRRLAAPLRSRLKISNSKYFRKIKGVLLFQIRLSVNVISEIGILKTSENFFFRHIKRVSCNK